MTPQKAPTRQTTTDETQTASDAPTPAPQTRQTTEKPTGATVTRMITVPQFLRQWARLLVRVAL
jgi:hypothetical protein